MNDLISRQAAIDAVEFGITHAKAIDIETGKVTDLFATTNKELEKAINRLAQLPSAERRGRWIPVAERRPEAYGRYLVTLEYEGYRSVMPLYYGRINRIDTFYDSDSEYGDIEYCGAIAWMPLPEPYKGGEKE